MLEHIVLLLLMVLVCSMALTFVMHLFLVVPFVPTSSAVIDEMIRLADFQPNDTLYDLGAGDARLLVSAKKKHPSLRAYGYELIPTIWIAGLLRIWISGQNITFYCRDLYTAATENADVIFLYMLPSVMGKLEKKLDETLKPGTRVVSHAFQFKRRKPVKEVKVGKSRVFVYEW